MSSGHGHTVVPNVENPPKIILKNSWNWRIILVPATIWQVLNMKCTEWTETEAIWIGRNLYEKILWNHFKLTYFWRVLAVWNQCGSVCRVLCTKLIGKEMQKKKEKISIFLGDLIKFLGFVFYDHFLFLHRNSNNLLIFKKK